MGRFEIAGETIRTVTEKYKNLCVISGLGLVPHDPVYFTDGIHPNDEGFEHFSRNLIAAVRELL